MARERSSERARPRTPKSKAPLAPALASNASLKAFHAVLLHTFPTETVREFWRPILGSFGGLTEPEVYRHLWNEAGASPGVVLSEVTRRFERTFWENGKDVTAAVDALLSHMNRGHWIQASEFLKRVHWVLPKLFRASRLSPDRLPAGL
jgi:hypothetical protein